MSVLKPISAPFTKNAVKVAKARMMMRALEGDMMRALEGDMKKNATPVLHTLWVKTL